MDKESCLFNTLPIETWVINLKLILKLWLLLDTLGTETFAQAKQANLGKNFGPECMSIPNLNVNFVRIWS